MTGNWFRTALVTSLSALALCSLPVATWAQLPLPGAPVGPDLAVSIDENGVVIVDGQRVAPIRGVGIPTFPLGTSVVAGDVVLLEHTGEPIAQDISDVLRFPNEGQGLATTIQLISDNFGGAENLSDTGLPIELQPNTVRIFEDPSEITLYPAGTNSYLVFSDANIVPEPGTLSLLGTGGLPLLGFLRRRRRGLSSSI